MKQFLITVLLLFIMATTTHAQEFSCGFDNHHQEMMKDPFYKQEYERLNKIIYQQVTSHLWRMGSNNCNIQTGVYEIPVVVHVLDTSTITTICTDQKAQEAVDGMNERWSRIIGDGVDMDIRFVFARRDPNGNITTGINRIDASIVPGYRENGLSTGVDVNALQDLSLWPWQDYINIWVLTYIDGVSGTANRPSNYFRQGILIRDEYFTKNSVILSHEMGHYFDLSHTFEGSTSSVCASNTDCFSQGDRICDTPPHRQNECSTICGSSGVTENTTKNYMSYCGILSRFTQGQKDRVQAVLMGEYRVSLITSPGLIPATTPIEVSIDSIEFLENTTQPLCDWGLTVSVKLENIGVNTINSVKLRLFLNDIDMGSSTINPSTFRGGQSQWVALPSIIIPESGNYSVRVEIEKVNNQVDYSVLNNTVCTSVDLLVDQVVVTTGVSPVNAGTAGGGKTMTCDGNVELVAVSAPGYSFKNWTENGWIMGTDSTLRLAVSLTDADRNIIANFKQNIPSAVKTAETTIGNLFPNPATETLVLQLAVKKPATITLEVVDLLGRVFDTQTIQVSGEIQTKLNVGNYPKGCYLIKITDNQGVATRTFLVQ